MMTARKDANYLAPQQISLNVKKHKDNELMYL